MNDGRAAVRRILVIKHGALGDFILATGPFRAIHAHHPEARLTLLTTSSFERLGSDCGCFDDVWIDDRPWPHQVVALFRLRKRLLSGRFDRVYDLQTSDRTGWYYRLFPPPRPEWCGIAAGCSHLHDNPDRDRMHVIDSQVEQLRLVGIDSVPRPGIDWLEAPVSGLGLPEEFALLVPGGSPRRPGKRWPAARYAALARRLSERGLTPVLIGADAERDVIAAIADRCKDAIDLCGRTSLAQLASLCRRARVAVGNDTGPMHVAALAGCGTVVLFSRDSDPALCAPRGAGVVVVRRERLEDLSVDEVWRDGGLATR